MDFIDSLAKYAIPFTIEKTTHYKKVMSHLQKYPNISRKTKNELDFFYLDMIYHSLINKEKIDEIFKVFYLENQQILNRLNYQEKTHLLNTEISHHIDSLMSFEKKDTKIVIPFFDERMNKIYLYDRTLFELRQYRVFVEDFYLHMEKPWVYYKDEIFKSPFTCLKYILEDERFICLYYKELGCVYILRKDEFEIHTRLYVIDRYSDLESLSIDKIKVAVSYYLNYQFKECLDYLYENKAISEKVYQKILKKYS